MTLWADDLGKYDPLAGHLRRQKSERYEMSFGDIERVIAGLLPNSAQRPEWWANEASPESRHVQCRAWLSAGFKAYLLAGKDRVRFERN